MKKDYFLGLSEEGFHRIAYMEWGSPSTRTPIICVHGLTRNAHDFDALAAYLSETGFHLYCPDIVGRGDSDWLRDPLHYTYEQYMADMTALIARTNAREVNWIGTSMGGLIGMALAALPHSPIKHLILNDIGPQIPLKGIQRLAKYTGKDPDFSSLDEAKNYFKTVYSEFGQLSDEEWQRLAETSTRKTDSGKFVSKLDHGVKSTRAKTKVAWKTLLNPHKALEGLFFDVDLWEIWEKIRCPVLVIRGTQSDILLPETIKKMQHTHGKVDVIEIQDAGHAPMLQAPQLREKIYQWLIKEK